jgi:hypothetical protein
MREEKRKYRRIATEFQVSFSEEKVSRKARQYLMGVAENCGLGGMFILTDHLFPKGSILKLKFQPKFDTGNPLVIKARAIVRWVQRWHKPSGMGVEFIEFEGLGNYKLAVWLEMIFEGS